MTRNIAFLLSIILAFSAIAVRAAEKTVTISTKDIQLVYKVDKGNKLRQCYFGESSSNTAHPGQWQPWLLPRIFYG